MVQAVVSSFKDSLSNATALFLLGTRTPGSHYDDVLRWLLLLGLGQGLFQSPNNVSVMGDVPRWRHMRIIGNQVDAVFLQRLNRFAALVDVAGQEALAHVPNSGRMRELLAPGAPALLVAKLGPRKTAFDLAMVRHEGRWVGVDARLPSKLLEEALGIGLPDLGPFHSIRREVPFGESRLDLLGLGPDGPCLIETKSVNLVRQGVALFPDAPTLRGTRHLEELHRAAEMGYRAAVVFVVQRDDAICVRPFEEADPLFASTLCAVSPPVLALAYACEVERGEIRIHHNIPVIL